MSSYLYVWPNGDVSFVSAKTKDDAVFLLDEVGDVDQELLESRPFAVHLRIDPEDSSRELVLERLNEETSLELYSRGYDSEETDMDIKKPIAQNPTGTPTDTASNTTVTTESGSKASEHPLPGDTPEGIVEPPAAKTREDAAKAVKEQQKKE